MAGIMGAGGAGEANNYKIYILTTSGTINTETSQDLGQPVFWSKIINDSDTNILLGFDNDTSQSNKVWTIKPGEVLEIELVYQTLYMKCGVASKAFRVFVIW